MGASGASVMDILANYNPTGFVQDNRKRDATIANTQASTQHQLGAAELARQEAALKGIEAKRAELAMRDEQILGRGLATVERKLDDTAQAYIDRLIQHGAKNGMSSVGILGTRKRLLDMEKETGALTKDQLANEGAAHSQAAQHLEAYNANPDPNTWGQTRANILKIDPTVQLPEAPPEKPQLEALNGLFHLTDKFISQQKDRLGITKAEQDAAHAAKMNPLTEAEAQRKGESAARTEAIQRLTASTSPGQYSKVLDELPHGLARQMPPAAQVFDEAGRAKPESVAALRSLAMTPHEASQTETAAKNAEMNVTEYELEIRAAKGDQAAKAALANRHAMKMAEAAAKGAASGAAVRGLDREIGQFGKPFDEITKSADQQLDKILDAEKMVAGGAVQQALAVPKILTALVSGQGSGVRITQAEMNSILKARGIVGDIEGFFRRIGGQGKFTDVQKQQMEAILGDVRQRLIEKKMIARATQDEMQSATNRDDILAAAKKGRDALDAHASKGGGGKIATMDQVRAYAAKHNISEAEAKRISEAEGYQVR